MQPSDPFIISVPARPGARRWRCVIGFWGSLFGGKNDTLNNGIGQFGQVAGYGIGQGEQDTSAASGFFKSILSGDASKQAQALAPEISADKKATQQDQKTTALFNGRSGGTAASNNASSDKVHSDITNLIGSLTGKSADSLASMGANLLSQGTSALGSQVDASQIRMKNWEDSILGLGTTSAVGAAEGFALGKI